MPMTAKGRRKDREPDDIETLKEWCLWMRKREPLDEVEMGWVKAVENVISQVGTWKAKYERLLEKSK